MFADVFFPEAELVSEVSNVFMLRRIGAALAY